MFQQGDAQATSQNDGSNVRKRQITDVTNFDSIVNKSKKTSFSEKFLEEGMSTRHHDQSFVSNIPRPSSTQEITLKPLSDKNKKPSAIPTPMALNNRQKSPIDLQRINVLMGLKDTLSKRPEDSSMLSVESQGLSSRVVKLEQTLAKELPTHDEAHRELNNELKDLTKSTDELDHEILEMKRCMKKANNKLVELVIQMDQSKRRYEFMEDSVMKNVSHKEGIINVQIGELSNSLSGDYEEVQFQINDEIQRARFYKDDELTAEIKSLKLRMETLSHQLEETKLRKQQTLNSETNTLERQIETNLGVKFSKLGDLKKRKEVEVQNFENAAQDFELVQREFDENVEEIKSLEETISQYEYDTNNFSTRKDSLIVKLNGLNNEMGFMRETSDSLERHLQSEKLLYETALDRNKKYDFQIMRIKNSILEYDRRHRVYVKSKDNLEDNSMRHFGKIYKFSMVIDASLRSSNENLIYNFQAPIQNFLNGNNISLIFSGKTDFDLISSSVLQSYKTIISGTEDKKFRCHSVYLQCLEIDDTLIDIFDSNKRIEFYGKIKSLNQISSQKMIIEDEESLSYAMREYMRPSKVLFILRISAERNEKPFSSDLMFFDLTSSDLNVQVQELKLFLKNQSDSLVGRLMEYARHYSEALFVSDITRLGDNYTGLLNTLVDINAIKI